MSGQYLGMNIIRKNGMSSHVAASATAPAAALRALAARAETSTENDATKNALLATPKHVSHTNRGSVPPSSGKSASTGKPPASIQANSIKRAARRPHTISRLDSGL